MDYNFFCFCKALDVHVCFVSFKIAVSCLLQDYELSIMEGKCFACKQREVLWANIPCKHFLWCADCKVQAILAARSFTHKCVVCDVEVHKIDLLPCQDSRQLVDENISHVEFPSFYPKHKQR